MKFKRSKNEQIIDILKVIQSRKQIWNEETTITRLMYGSNLDWRHLMKLVPAMVESGLITNSTKNFERSVKRYYSLTDKGRDAIKQFDWLCETLNTSAEDSETGRA